MAEVGKVDEEATVAPEKHLKGLKPPITDLNSANNALGSNRVHICCLKSLLKDAVHTYIIVRARFTKCNGLRHTLRIERVEGHSEISH